MSQPSTAKEQGGVLSGVMPTTYNANDPITLFIIQVIMIVFFTRILHLVLSRFRQPRVISEIIGGIILGPSVLGHIPGYMDTIFPVVSRPNLNLLSTLGLILFLFIVGVELNPTVLIKNARVALTISAAGIALPFALGIGVGYGLYHAMGNDYVSFSSFILFIGVAMSITAFPVLARILSELQLLRTPVGSTALAAGVGDDVAAWVLLALVVTIINASNSLVALYVFLLAIAWVLIVIFAIRPILLKLIVKTGSNDNGPTVTMMVITLSLVLISSFVTNIIGVHAIFGGFIIGVIIPHEGGFAVGITEKIEDLVNVLFLPIYFALSGIKTQIGLLNDGASWGWVILVIVVAMTGKITGATLAARFNKLAWRESLTIGVFMSCKGLVELIVLNIGLDAKVINDKVFVIMVAMALVTTIVTTPLATWLYPHEYQRKMELKRIGHSGPGDGSQVSDETISTKKNRLLIVLNKVEYLPPMMMLVQLLQPLSAFVKQQGEKDTSVLSKSSDSITVHVLRLVELTQRISTVMKINENEETLHDPIMNIFRTFGQLNFVKVKANLAVVAQQDFAQHVAERAEDTDANFVIIPWGGAGAIIDDPSNPFVGPKEKKETSPQVAHFTQEVFSEVSIRANVGVFVDRGLGVSSLTTSIENGISNISVRVFLPFFGGIDDREALSFVIQLLDHPNVSVNVLRIKKSSEPTENDAILKKNTFSTETEENNTQDNSEEPQRPSLIHKISSASAHILNSNDEREASDNADEELLTQTLKSRTGVVASNARINYTEILSSTPLQTAVNRAKEVVGRKDLIVVGRGREIGPVFRAEDSFTHRHLCEFTGLDLEMEIKEHYFEVLDIIDKLFVSIFDGLNEKCKKELDAIDQQYPFEPLKYLRKTLRLKFAEGVQMLKDAGINIDPLGDLNTETEKKLGQLVRDKYDTDFYILHRYPMAIRPFYTMPCVDDPLYSNSFDVFIRGEEIISGAQRVHDPELLTKRAKECGIDVSTISTYIDSFRWGAVPHGGAGVGLERVVMLFCALNNIRKTSLFPRDPQRLAP